MLALLSILPIAVVALQAVGGAAGNMICVHNVVAASAVVGLLGREGLVIRQTFWAFVYYAGLSGAMGYWIVWSAQKGFINIGSVIGVLVLICAAIMIYRANRAA